VSKLNEGKYPVWKKKIHRVHIAQKAYNIVTGVELLPVGIGVALHPLHESWRDRANKALARIHLECCDKLLTLIHDLDNRMQMREPLKDLLDNALTKLGHTQVLGKLTTSQP